MYAAERYPWAMMRLAKIRSLTVEQLDELVRSSAGEVAFEPASAPDRAQWLMYDAWAASRKKRLALARQALTIDPDCADAYVALAQAASSDERAAELYERGVAGGKRSLGSEFDELRGKFEATIQTRPYMRALRGLTYTLARLNRLDEAAGHALELLELDEEDRSQARYVAVQLLLAIDDTDRLSSLLERFDEESTPWVYAKALVAFREHGDCRTTRAAYDRAFAFNPYVPLFLIGDVEFPEHPSIEGGERSQAEAVAYVSVNRWLWLQTPGALALMLEIVETIIQAEAARGRGDMQDRHSILGL